MDARSNLVYKYAQEGRRWNLSGIRTRQLAIFASKESDSQRPLPFLRTLQR